ncbi:MAG: bacillithiol biosynthesis deacetylase BshB1 [Anaerolineae bacterium]|jgi:bacillithiol biosynthesis deacetylase BshB1|nr:bacillithiol biosynthesis deacetylase BshB1 [Chloroflexota bacterium]
MPDMDVMAIGAHPDDIEIGCGGTLIKLAQRGHSIVLVDMSRGEMATRGTIETRRQEAAAATAILGASARENLELEDGNIHSSPEARYRIARVVRKYRPAVVLLPWYEDRHPDHYHTSQAAYEGLFAAGLVRLETGQAPHRPTRVMYYMGWYEFDPTFVVDISEQFEQKMRAIYAYTTQFLPDDQAYQQTRLTSNEYNWHLTSRAAHWGAQIGVRYGEAFRIRGTMAVDDPLDVSFATF